MVNIEFIAEPGGLEVITTAILDAPREKIFKVFVDPNLLPHWWGPRGIATTVEKMDVKPGGTWRFVQVDNEGNAYAFHGYYHHINEPDSVIFTFEFEGMPGHVLLETVTFEDLNGKTRIIDQSVYQSLADRDGMVNMGMESGSRDSMERLEELVSRQVKKQA